MPRRKPRPFLNWRILAHNRDTDRYEGPAIDLRFQERDAVEFDELVICDPKHPDGGFIHLEVMDEGHLWMDVCGVKVDVYYQGRTVSVQNECEDGWTMVTP
jgi:hypothetical protein